LDEAYELEITVYAGTDGDVGNGRGPDTGKNKK